MATDFSAISVDASQEDNVAGNVAAVYMALAKSFTANWPTLAQMTDGEVTTAPTLSSGKKFSKIVVPQNTVRTYDSFGGDAGFQSGMQGIEFNYAGMKKEIVEEIEYYKNAGAVFMVEDANGVFVAVGTVNNPIHLTREGDSGKVGGDKRGFTFKGEQTGYLRGRVPVAASVISGLTFNLPS